MPKFYSGNGHPLEPGKLLGRGGEGAVHEIDGRPGFVAKIYHQPVGPDKALKLESMARQAHPGLLEIAAWPVDVLRDGPQGPVQGFIMPQVKGYHEIHSLYGPSHRKRTFPQADWSFLVHAARNLASAFETIHARGNVIGDVNPGNVVVSGQAMVKMIDCDSFQIDTGSRLFLCEVGVPQFTAPELQDRPFHGMQRGPNHDAFGLALLCFHLLFMGRHPFAGRYRGKGDMPIERAIKEYRFAFGRQAAARLMEPPPHTFPFEALPQPVALLFDRAFSVSTTTTPRPTAREWFAALERLNRELRACGRKAVHKYPATAASCPWCELERASGTVFFVTAPSTAPAEVWVESRNFHFETAWNRILAVAPPAIEAMPRPGPQAPTVPTPLPEPLKRAQRLNLLKTAAIAGVATVAALSWPRLLWIWLPLSFAAWSLARDPVIRREQQRRRLALLAARRELTELRAAWQQRGTHQAFVRKLHELHVARDRYHHLSADFQKDLQRLETDQRQQRLQSYLEGYFIDSVQLPGIHATDRMALASYGIETAADISAAALDTVPGFGQHRGRQRAAALLDWRQSLERRFRQQPSQGSDPAAIATLQQQYAQRREQFEQALLAGPDELAKLKADLIKQRAQLNIALIRQAMQEAQARADLRVFYPNLATFLHNPSN
ncbi:MAG: hypothetical protein JNM60_08530 [Candidatus Competibacteraceae bacterium]|nr:hypothetical protein [Candidatus Competibacteraceae bacterium]